ncbi:MAG: hypothetical protein CVU97_06865 [Firmicutes bacterium HGW-Firmicutes-21]|nr:MAG: hypothetical protein CVU97_06865 [Firmicutes bacterium HGW-Firmicutes-21]
MKILAYGEILWDIFGDKREIGGAPFNFSAHMARLGADCYIFSALGRDKLGDEAIDKVRQFNISSDYISFLSKPTGCCNIYFEGETPRYELTPDVAYDYIPFLHIKESYDAFYMGTLAQRSEVSAFTLSEILKEVKVGEVFLDINIRQSFYTHEIINNSLKSTSILKFSREESKVFSALGIADDNNIDALCSSLASKYPLKIILVTLDKDGALLFDCSRKSIIHSHKPMSSVVSAVGAGDSFSACFLYNYLNGAELQTALDRAVTLSDYVVTRLGAIPEYEQDLLEQIK